MGEIGKEAILRTVYPGERRGIPRGPKCSAFQALSRDCSVPQQVRRVSRVFLSSETGHRKLRVPIPSDLHFLFT